MTDNAICPNCQGEHWVCDDHPEQPWGGGDECCGAPGAPCPSCNACGPNEWPAMPPDSTIIWDRERGFLN